MFLSTLEQLRCPARRGRCGGALALERGTEEPRGDVRSGALRCESCKASYPILAGVALLVPIVSDYLLEHVKGISRHVADAELPAEHRRAFARAREELGEEHIEEDLEAERVTSLYFATHYLSAPKGAKPGEAWWAPAHGPASPLIDELVRAHWDHGPLARVGALLASAPAGASLLELGCGVGGLCRAAAPKLSRYLGVDASFASVAMARRLALGSQDAGPAPRLPSDLLDGPLTRAPSIAPAPRPASGTADFVVGDAEHPPVREGAWDFCAALNLIDMLEQPAALPKLQAALLKRGGVAIQSSPYVWHPQAARKLRAAVPAKIRDSAAAVEWLYENSGLRVEQRDAHVPWLFFKHARQLEIYSVHLMSARKT